MDKHSKETLNVVTTVKLQKQESDEPKSTKKILESDRLSLPSVAKSSRNDAQSRTSESANFRMNKTSSFKSNK